MTNASSAFLVDTNVLVYAYDTSDEGKRARAIQALERVQAQRLGALSAQVLGEFFVTVIRKIPLPLTPAEAERSVTNYVRSWPVYDIASATVVEAVRGVHQHHWS
jgi:predicted nucleic acid-binding protein